MCGRTVQCATVFSCLVLMAGAMEKTSMYMKRSEVNDQAMSGSGYSYNGDTGKPQQYSFQLGDTSKLDLSNDPFSDKLRFPDNPWDFPIEQTTKSSTKQSQTGAVTFIVGKAPDANIRVASLYPNQPVSVVNQYNKVGIYPYAYPYAIGYARASPKSYVKKGGKTYDESTSSKKGEKTDSGYKTIDAFKKGLFGTYDNRDIKSIYDQSGGKKSSSYDYGGNYGLNYGGGGAAARGSFGQADGHNKGSKTTGYHKVYRKDDYDKQHRFYDKADRRGRFNKYGNLDAKGGNAEAQFVSGGHKDSGYDNDKYGASDVSDHGDFEQVARGFKKAKGNEGYYQDYEAYDKKNGKEKGETSGFRI